MTGALVGFYSVIAAMIVLIGFAAGERPTTVMTVAVAWPILVIFSIASTLSEWLS